MGMRRTLSYIPELDGLRAIAVFLVLWRHAPFFFAEGREAAYQSAFWRGGRLGWTGVDLFFVLSGFLITRILRHGRDQPGRLATFWVRRALRIFPLFYLYLAVVWATTLFPEWRAAAGMERSIAHGTLPAFSLYVGNWFMALHLPFPHDELGPLWSLAVEEQFYFVWPFVVWSLSGRSLRRTCMALVALGPVLRFVVPRIFITSDPTWVAYTTTLCRLDTLAMGALLAVLMEGERKSQLVLRAARWVWPFAFAGIAVLSFEPIAHHVADRGGALFAAFGYSYLGVCYTVLLARVLEAPAWLSRLLCFRPIAALGRISYGMYVWQWLAGVVLAWAARPLTRSPWGFAAVWICATIAVSAASYRLCEAPLLRLKVRFKPAAKAVPSLST
jgi:peptidoglycan/LPS O-acetylase OafA/YrhL